MVNDLFLNIQKFEEVNAEMRELVDKSPATFASQKDEKKTQETVDELFEAQGLAFQHAGALGEIAGPLFGKKDKTKHNLD